MKVYLYPEFNNPDKGEGGIRRVVEHQRKYLPAYGVEFVDSAEQADVVNVHGASWVNHPTVVLSNHGLYWHDNPLGGEFEWLRWGHQANEFIINHMKLAKSMTVPSEWVRHAIVRGTLQDSIVVPHGITLSDWSIPAEHGEYVLWNKNRVDSVCDPTPMNLLAAKVPGITFVSTHGEQADNVKLIGTMPHSDMANFVQHSMVYLATTLETGGVGTLEAMACGVPVLGYNFGGTAEIVDHMETGYLVEPGDVDGLVEGLDYCLRHRDRLGRQAREVVEQRYQWEQVIGGYYKAYQQALQPEHRPTVSVVVTAYELEEYLPETLESLIAQDFDDWEAIVVDDASPDRCGEIAESFAARDSRIRVVHNETNLHVSQSRNKGFRLATGKYLMTLDGDDYLHPKALGILSRALDSDPYIDIVTGKMRVFGGRKEFVSDWPTDNPHYQMQISGQNAVPYSSMYRRWVWEKTGGYRARMKSGEDAEFWTRAMSYGAKAQTVTKLPLLNYRLRPNSLSHTVAAVGWRDWFIWSRIPSLAPSAVGHVRTYGPPVVSVVVPVGPGHDVYIQDCVDSIVNQTEQNWELILVNDTGVKWLDEEGKAVSPYIQGMPYARIIDSETVPLGVANARNRGIEAARTNKIVLIDADDYAQPQMLEHLLSAQEEMGGWVYTDWYDQEGNVKLSKDWDAEGLTRQMLGPVVGIYLKSDWERVGGFDEDAPGWEDWNFQLSLCEAGVCGSRLAYPAFTYRYHLGSNRERDFSQAKELLQYIREKFISKEGELFMACRSCGKRKTTTVTTASATSGPTTLSAASQEQVLVEYTGSMTQFRTIRSKVVRGATVRIGGPVGSPTRFVYMYKDDADALTKHRDYRIVKSQSPKRKIVEEVAPVTVQREPTVEHVPALDELDLPGEVITILKNNGVSDIREVRSLSMAGLMSFDGIGYKRAEQIKKAVENYGV